MRKVDIRPVEKQVVETGTRVAKWLYRLVRFIVVSFLVAVLYYVVFALVYDTDEERTLREENGMLKEQYSAIEDRTWLLDDVVAGITARDEAVYYALFNSSIPDYIVNSVTTSSLDFDEMSAETEAMIVERTNEAAMRAGSTASVVSSQLDSLYALFSGDPHKIREIPSIAPVEGFSIGQSGASVGDKYNPFFKTPRFHRGFDIMAPVGTNVLATAEGRVSLVRMNDKSDGRVVEITHANGMVTTYKHLGEVLVTRGQNVRRGAVIAKVGMSGRSFAPHLHYEVTGKGECLDPVHFFFASGLDEISCAKMLLMASTTGQSMD